MKTLLDSQEVAALEYLVSSACQFVVEFYEEAPDEYGFRPAEHRQAIAAGDYRRGQRFWDTYHRRTYNSPFEAAVMFVNAVRRWQRDDQGTASASAGLSFH